MKTEELFAYDIKCNAKLLAGMDEAGRGPLAGPVVAACVVMPLNRIIDGINDSKKVSERKREELYGKIVSEAVSYGVGIVGNKRIDEINILEATKEAMRIAFNALTVKPTLLLVDAVKIPGIECSMRDIVKGDATSYNIAAASIIAKVTRDRLMREYDREFPQYGFIQNKGYGTKLHTDALKAYGKCAIHRDTFIKNFVGGEK